MSFLPAVDFNAAYKDNQNGFLHQNQIEALAFMLKARIVTGFGLFTVYFLGVLLFGGVILTGSWEKEFNLQMMFLGFLVCFLVGAVYGWKIWRSAKKARTNVSTILLTKIVGEAKKYNFGVAAPVAGATHTYVLKHGYIKIDGKKYGVLNPQLYGEIVEGKKTDFFVAEVYSAGFNNGVVVNCSN